MLLKTDQKLYLYELIKSFEEPELDNNVQNDPESDLLLKLYAENIDKLTQAKAKEQNTKKLFLGNLKLVLDIVKKRTNGNLALDFLEYGNNLLRELTYKYKGKNFSKFAKKEIEQKIDEKLKESKKYFKASCFVCLLLTTFASQVQASETQKNIQFTKPSFLNQSDWQSIKVKISEVSSKYQISETHIYSQIAINSGLNQKQKLIENLGSLEEKLKDTSKVVRSLKEELNKSLKEQYPNSESWKYKIPSFVNDFEGDVQNIQVSFPGSSSSGRIVAQISFDGPNGKSLIAVPVKLENSDELQIAQSD